MIDALLSKLTGVQGKGPRWRAICCVHESKNKTRSLAIYEPEPGRILIHCHAGCSVHDIAAKLGIQLSDLFPPVGDDDKRPSRERRPWRASELITALRGELLIAWVLLSDVATGQPHTDEDRKRAATARERIAHFMGELERAG